MKCVYCGEEMNEGSKQCPSCGSWNGVPETIEELKAFCEIYQLPLERMRFFIGEDFQEPRAFGVFRDADGRFVVYKNKEDGSRAVRYCGPDEAYAVNELFQKMKSEVELRRDKQAAASAQKSDGSVWPVVVLIFAAIIAVAIFFAMRGPSRGYYFYDDSYYYYQDDDWYCYDSGYWYEDSYVDDALSENPDDYWCGSSYDADYGIEDFEDSPYYDDSSSDSSSDSSIFDSWDSNDTDWGSDW